MSKRYNGHRNYDYWNVALWLFNDEGMYRFMRHTVESTRTLDEAARELLAALPERTPDGAAYTLRNVRAALAGEKRT
jgi:hypothetical protein